MERVPRDRLHRPGGAHAAVDLLDDAMSTVQDYRDDDSPSASATRTRGGGRPPRAGAQPRRAHWQRREVPGGDKHGGGRCRGRPRPGRAARSPPSATPGSCSSTSCVASLTESPPRSSDAFADSPCRRALFDDHRLFLADGGYLDDASMDATTASSPDGAAAADEVQKGAKFVTMTISDRYACDGKCTQGSDDVSCDLLVHRARLQQPRDASWGTTATPSRTASSRCMATR